LTLKRIGIVTGLKSEAGCLKSEDVVCAGADSARAYNLAKQLADNGCLSLMSFGIAGGLAPHLNPGNIVIGEKVVGSENDEIECDFAGRQKLLEILQDNNRSHFGKGGHIQTLRDRGGRYGIDGRRQGRI